LQSAIPVNCNERGETTEIVLIPASGSISPGAYDLSLQQGSDGNTLLDGCGNESLPQTLSFQIDVLDAIIDYTISSSCNADTFYFSFDGLSSPLSYQWVLNGDTITQPDFTYVFPDIGNFDVELTTFSQNCSAQDFETVSPANIHRAGFSATERACVGTEVMFTDETRGNPDAWEWRFEPGGTSNLQNPDYTFNQSGNFNVRLIAIDNTTNCRDTFFQTIEIVDEPVLDFDTPDEICQNESFDIEYTGTGIQQNIEWIIGGDTIQEEAPTLNIAEIGETNIQLIFTDSICGVFTLEKNISINEVPYFDLGNDTLICPLDNIRLNAFSRADRIRWSTGETSEEIVVDTFNLFVSARAQLGTCSYRDTIYIGTKEEDCFKIIMPSAFSPNGDGLNDFYKVLSKKLESFTLRIYNRWGELIFEEENNRFGGWDGTYKGQGVDVGVYTYYVKGKTLLGDKIDQTGILTLIR
ncbi:MAG: gliding motility-associated C-terminal domain-containing protein, partial [Chitinophagales bacterium]